MKKIVLLAMIVVPLAIRAQQQNFVLKGTLKQINTPAKVRLMYNIGGGWIMDTMNIVQGRFQFKGHVFKDAPVLGNLWLMHNSNDSLPMDVLWVYLDKGTIQVTANDSIHTASISGSKLNDENRKYQNVIRTVEEKILAAHQGYYSAPADKQNEKSFKDAYEVKVAALEANQLEVTKHFITVNPSLYISLIALSGFVNNDSGPAPAVADALYKRLSGELRSTPLGIRVEKLIMAKRMALVGSTAPLFTQNDVDGKPVSLVDFRGKYVLIDFWASWCHPCREENPNVVRVYQKYKDKNFTVLGVSLDAVNSKKAWLNAIRSDSLTWTQVSDLKYGNNEVALLYGVKEIPDNFLIDPNGKIVARGIHGDDLEKKIAELIK